MEGVFMLTFQPALAALWLLAAPFAPGERRRLDSSGQYSLEATLVDFDTSNAVLKKQSGELIMVPITQLSSTIKATCAVTKPGPASSDIPIPLACGPCAMACASWQRLSITTAGKSP